MDIIDLNGRIVKTLINNYQNQGRHHVEWDGTDTSGGNVASGVYLYRVETEDITKTMKLLIIK